MLCLWFHEWDLWTNILAHIRMRESGSRAWHQLLKPLLANMSTPQPADNAVKGVPVCPESSGLAARARHWRRVGDDGESWKVFYWMLVKPRGDEVVECLFVESHSRCFQSADDINVWCEEELAAHNISVFIYNSGRSEPGWCGMARARGHEHGDRRDLVSPCLTAHFVSSSAVDAVQGPELKKFSVDRGRESTAVESQSSPAFIWQMHGQAG